MNLRAAATILEDEIYALSCDLRLARFALSEIYNQMIPEDEVSEASQEALLLTDSITREYLEIITDYLHAASEKLDALDKLRKVI